MIVAMRKFFLRLKARTCQSLAPTPRDVESDELQGTVKNAVKCRAQNVQIVRGDLIDKPHFVADALDHEEFAPIQRRTTLPIGLRKKLAIKPVLSVQKAEIKATM